MESNLCGVVHFYRVGSIQNIGFILLGLFYRKTYS